VNDNGGSEHKVTKNIVTRCRKRSNVVRIVETNFRRNGRHVTIKSIIEFINENYEIIDERSISVRHGGQQQYKI